MAKVKVFRSPKPTAQESYCHSALSVRPAKFFIFSTSLKPPTEFNETLQESRSQRPLTSLCFRVYRKNKMVALSLICWVIFRLLLWNSWTEFNETCQEARSQRPLLSLCFSNRSENQDGRPGIWLSETFLTSPLNGIWRNLTGSKIPTSPTKFVLFWPIRKPRWPEPLIGWDIFDVFSETDESNQRNLSGNKALMFTTNFVFSGRSENQDGHPSLWFDWKFSTSLKLLNTFQRNFDRKQYLNVLY